MVVVCAALVAAFLTGITRADPTGEDSDSSKRSRVWAEIITIRDESVASVESRETVKIHKRDGSTTLLATFDARFDDMRNVRILGDRYWMNPKTKAEESDPVATSLNAGVARAFDSVHESGITSGEKPGGVLLWSVPSTWTGLGRSVNLRQLRTRADHLKDCPDMRVASEDSDRVVLTGMGRVDSRLFVHRLELDAHTGDVLVHQLINSTWGHVFVEWRMAGWQEMNGGRVPAVTEYRVFSLGLSPEKAATVSSEVKAAGLTAADMEPTSARYPEWVQIRNRLVGAPVQTPPLESWQVAHSEIRSVNLPVVPGWTDLPSGPVVKSFFSAALECPVDAWELEPARVPALQSKDSKAPQ